MRQASDEIALELAAVESDDGEAAGSPGIEQPHER